MRFLRCEFDNSDEGDCIYMAAGLVYARRHCVDKYEFATFRHSLFIHILDKRYRRDYPTSPDKRDCMVSFHGGPRNGEIEAFQGCPDYFFVKKRTEPFRFDEDIGMQIEINTFIYKLEIKRTTKNLRITEFVSYHLEN